MIETLSGKKVRAEEIVLSKPVRFQGFGKSIGYLDGWGALTEFYQGLRLENDRDE